MPNNNRKTFEKMFSKTRIYLAIIAISLILLSIQNTNYIAPSIVVYAAILAYAYKTDNKNKTEITQHIEEITFNVDSTAKNTLINSPFPLAIIETDGNIVWKSANFIVEFGNIDIKNIINDLSKEIKLEIENKVEKKQKTIERQLEIGKRQYKVIGKYIKTKQKTLKKKTEYTVALYFVDNTENLDILKKYEDSKTCIGIISIDNYEETLKSLTTEEKPQVLAQIEKTIYEWAAKTNGVAIKNERDTYIYVFEKKYLNTIKDTKFEILDTIKEIEIEGLLQLTISIAISCDGETNYEKYKSALGAMDIALGRGGDQAVVRENGKYSFFGGRTQEVEKRTKVKARIIAHALEELIKEADNVMVMGHANGDIDSMGSSLGIYRFVKTMGKDAKIVNNTYGLTLKDFIEAVEQENEYKDVIIDKNQAISQINSNTLLIIVDTHKKSYVEVPELLEKTNKVVVIDHHRRSADYIDTALLTFHEVYASSAAELVTELLQYSEKEAELTTFEAESLYGGIMVDTKNFVFKTGVRTFEAAAFLRKKNIDIIKIKKWFQSDLEGYNVIAEVVKNAEIINKNIGISIYEREDKNTSLVCAKAADELLTISQITASFVIGKTKDKVCISGRSIGDINVQLILEKLGGGGHITLAGAQLEGVTLEEAREMLIEQINEYFNENNN